MPPGGSADEAPPLTVVVATRGGWEQVRGCVDAFGSDAERMGVEVIVGDGSEHGTRPDPARVPVWIHRPGWSVARLYREAFARARGEVVVTTEDHCLPRPGWVAAVMGAHREHPTADVIGGAIENGATGTLADRASYYVTQARHMAPLPEFPKHVANDANVSLKRRVLPLLASNERDGLLLLLELERLARERAIEVRGDARMVVDHVQPLGLTAAVAVHFHDGRSIAGSRHHRLSRRDRVRLLGWGWLPWLRSARTIMTVLEKRRDRRDVLACAPAILLLQFAHATGELLGYTRGPGRSPTLLP
jgi:hypothetical protein